MDDNTMYHSDVSRIGKSGLDLVAKAPAYYYAKYLDHNREREKQTKALAKGSAFHTIVLEPEKFQNEYAVAPEFSGKGSVAKKDAWIEQNFEKKILSIDEYNSISRMRDAIYKHPLGREILSIGVTEQRIDWKDDVTGALCKAKPDFFNTSTKLLVDLKSTEDASENGFSRSSFKYRYHVQAPFYFDGAVHNGYNPQGFVFIAVEKEPPYLVNIFFADSIFMEFGRDVYRKDLTTYLECLHSGVWPGYSSEIKPLQLPRWALES